ncbi:glycerol-3-phosphate dehydrogenase/oxidase [Marinoscillum furvescens]|uniref:Glycerol-3-phosphate dehydrogenase n=1 Tax=Marinoscillum furvescens DSM 4134 TaxID=1122208 RepID=A0A3D9KXS8_MARFU|nr:glycerol-3-phosphate dehydrogenase/oxidase [Marinoscillum furvescens]RED93614.1 homodimeric glycerol 3-phosphate dehydrogenase (quinone) [Marinoscillum furvescens DSM 4134]
MSTFDATKRSELVHKLKNDAYDLVIIGGGITGAGIALDAASRGLKTALVEKNDFASGTSSKSTKLIHGGLRYLKQFEVALVREVGQERAVVHKLAPHLVKSEKMLLPLIKDGTYGKILTSVGLMVYDVLAGVEKVDQRKMLDQQETLEIEPLLDASKIEGGGIYAEYRTDDARLTIEILKTAVRMGADVINYAEATDFEYTDGKISGIHWKDHLTGEEHLIKNTFTISAAGPWVDEIRKKNKSLEGKHLHPTKGVHIVVPHEKFPVRQSVYFDVPDGRMIFAIPRDRVTYIGTTDTDYHGDINDVRTDKVDVEYLINGVQHIFPEITLDIADVESSWAGLRPLIEEEGKSASQLSRKDEIFESETGLLSIAGGKLTGYRKMAERIVDRLVNKMDESVAKTLQECFTDKIMLSGGVFKGGKDVEAYQREIEAQVVALGLDSYYGAYLVGNYGRQTGDILRLFHKRAEQDAEIRLALAELEYTIAEEAVHSLLDFFERRTGRLYFNINTIPKLIEPVTEHMTTAFGWDENRVRQEQRWLEHGLEVASKFD